MFLLDNVVIILLVCIGLFMVFTYLNIMTFSRDALTAIYLTVIFFDLFFKMPFKAVNIIHQEGEKMLTTTNFNKLTEDQKLKFQHILQSRLRIFFSLYRAGAFSYTARLINLTESYKNRPFKVKIKIIRTRKKSFESKYISDIQKNLVTLEA